LNDFFDVLRSNVRIIVPAAVLVVILAVVIGIIVGLNNASDYTVSEEPVETRLREMGPDRDETGLLVPGPVVPSLSQDNSENMYPDQQTDYIESFELKQVSVSELIEYRRRGVEVHFKPFRIENVEYEILSEKDELAEP
jgi:hypothetical protein